MENGNNRNYAISTIDRRRKKIEKKQRVSETCEITIKDSMFMSLGSQEKKRKSTSQKTFFEEIMMKTSQHWRKQENTDSRGKVNSNENKPGKSTTIYIIVKLLKKTLDKEKVV